MPRQGPIFSVPPAARRRPAWPVLTKEEVMQWITIAIPPLRSIEQFDAMQAEVGNPEGLEACYFGSTNGELRIVTVWESKADADRFFGHTLGPALARVLGPEPV